MKKTILLNVTVLSISFFAGNPAFASDYDAVHIGKDEAISDSCKNIDGIDKSYLDNVGFKNADFLLSSDYCIDKFNHKKGERYKSISFYNGDINTLITRYHFAYYSLGTESEKFLFVDSFLKRATHRYSVYIPHIKSNDYVSPYFYKLSPNGIVQKYAVNLFPQSLFDTTSSLRFSKIVKENEGIYHPKIDKLVDYVLGENRE